MVGLIHGLAGSAVLVLVVSTRVESSVLGMLYIALFGLGSFEKF